MTSSTFQSIPILDYSLSQGPQKPLFLNQLRHAIINVGFLYLKNHSVPASLVEEVKAYTPKFFELPQATKDKLRMANSQHFLGYSRLAAEITKGEVDQREQIDIGTEFECRYKEGDLIFTKLWGRSQWPDEADLQGFRAVVTEYFDSVATLSYRFLELLSESLGLAPDALNAFLRDPVDLCHRGKLVKYPAILPGSSDQGVGPHFDAGFLTFLLQVTDQPGLQVQNHKGEWIATSPIDGTFVVNIGKGLEAVTRNVALATSHRVLSPPVGSGPRYSIPFFQAISQHVRLSDYHLDFPPDVIELRSARGDTHVDSVNYSEFKTDYAGLANLIGRVKSHPDVAERHYPELFKKYYPNGMPLKASAY
ncbi:Clavaminate synthase-like protein [Sistotremastrum niveocremeum HHB9708]|uniref:Clavaminate synthase-like protein n=1 Tax=Sistotremastrum niveocremeum HHB9708 TaxID=1314777 RepID=A0A164TCA1_9AGAM|nr:Clavaminate synthase-like protein [Sistotremastrum niveocremeum HHB9708]